MNSLALVTKVLDTYTRTENFFTKVTCSVMEF